MAKSRSDRAYVLGVVSVFLFQLYLAPFAWSMASGELRAIDAGFVSESHRGTAVAARRLGIFGTILLGTLAVIMQVTGSSFR